MSRTARSALRARGRAYAPLFAALGDPTRLALVAKLCGGRECSISQLTENTALTRQAVTERLRVLENAGLVHHTRCGRERRFAFDPRPIEGLTGTSSASPGNGTRRSED